MNSSTIDILSNSKTTLPARIDKKYQLPLVTWLPTDKLYCSRSRYQIWKGRLILFWCITKNFRVKNKDIDNFMKNSGPNPLIEYTIPTLLALLVSKMILSSINLEANSISLPKPINKNSTMPMNLEKYSKTKSKPSQKSFKNSINKTKT